MTKQFFLILSGIFGFGIINAQPGTLDSSFGINGIVKSGFGAIASCDYYTQGNQVLLQDDGSIFIIAEANGQTIIAKRLANGSPDMTYGDHGLSIPVNISQSHGVLQQDGKIVVAGSAMARFKTDGKLDSTFGNDGIQAPIFFINSLVLQADGRIVAAGSLPDGSTSDFVVARYNADGTPDNTFSDDGIETTNFDSYKVGTTTFLTNDYGYSVGLQSDGKIVLLGYTRTRNNGDKICMSRYASDGTPDSTFNGTGKLITDMTSGSYPLSLQVQTDEKILVITSIHESVYAGPGVATSSTHFLIARYNADGTPDNSYGTNGKQNTDAGPYDQAAQSAVLQDDGKLLVAGGSQNRNDDNKDTTTFVVIRYDQDGNPDTGFGNKGMQTAYFNGKDNASSVVVQNDGKIVVAGTTKTLTGTYSKNFAVARYEPDGTPDNTFDMDGQLMGTVCTYEGYTNYSSIAIQKDGKIIAAGTAIARYYNDGTLDTAFNAGGFIEPGYSISSVALQGDGKIVVAGSSIGRYTTNGRPDTTFSSDGIQTINFNITALAIQQDGKILVLGNDFSTGNHNHFLARFNTDGNADNTFSGDGIQLVTFGSAGDIIKALAIQPDGKILVGGSAFNDLNNTKDFAVARYNPDGSVDNSFSDDGIQTSDYFDAHEFVTYHADDEITALAVNMDGKIVAAGGSIFPDRNQEFHFSVAIYETNGSEYSTNGVSFGDYNSTGPTTAASSIALQNNGQIIIGGHVGENSALARFNSDGSLDNSFGVGGKKINPLSQGVDVMNGIAIHNNKLYGAGYGQFPGVLGIVSRYKLYNGTNDIPPVISITDPVNDAVYTEPADISLIAIATDADGTIQKVEFYHGVTLFHTELKAPYTFTWKNVQAGIYSITAVATDNDGNTTSAGPVNVTIVAEGPLPLSLVHFDAVAKNDGRFVSWTTSNEYNVGHYEIERSTNAVDGFAKIYSVNANNQSNNSYSYVDIDLLQEDVCYYRLKIYDADGKITYSKIVRVRNIHSRYVLSIYPNPASDHINISLAERVDNGKLKIYNNAGTMVLYRRGVIGQNLQYDVSKLPAGSYSIQIAGENKFFTGKFIKE